MTLSQRWSILNRSDRPLYWGPMKGFGPAKQQLLTSICFRIHSKPALHSLFCFSQLGCVRALLGAQRRPKYWFWIPRPPRAPHPPALLQSVVSLVNWVSTCFAIVVGFTFSVGHQPSDGALKGKMDLSKRALHSFFFYLWHFLLGVFYSDGIGNVWNKQRIFPKKRKKKDARFQMWKSLDNKNNKNMILDNALLAFLASFVFLLCRGICESSYQQSIVIILSPPTEPVWNQSFVVRLLSYRQGRLPWTPQMHFQSLCIFFQLAVPTLCVDGSSGFEFHLSSISLKPVLFEVVAIALGF